MQKIKNYRPLSYCRLCNSPDLDLYFDFGKVPLGNNLAKSRQESDTAEKYPLNVKRCNTCNHFQLGAAVDPNKLYATNYTYLSGVGTSFVKHLNEYAKWVKTKCNLKKDALVIDVGSNDGTCLKEFRNLGYRVCGVDPAYLPAKIANESGIPTLNTFFDEKSILEIKNKYGKADFITSHNVLAHVDDLVSVFKNIYDILKLNGYFCFEIGYFKEVMKNNCFDTIYHEHLDYHHARPLAKFLISLGFDLIDLSTNNIQGGSLRLLLRKTGDGKIHNNAQIFLDNELNSILYQDKLISKWQKMITFNMHKFGKSVKKHVADGKKVAGYGVPTKATLLMALSNLNNQDISFMVEDNHLKVNKFMPGTSIPIYEVNELQIKKPDVIIIFAWNFCEDIIAKLKLQVDWPVTFLVPLPNFMEKSF